MQWGIYIHIPFCRQKCLYCDFASYAGREEDRAAYLQALEKEMRERVPRYLAKWGAPRTIYLGGGTPTALKPGQMAGLFDVLADILHGAYPSEWTVEVNPGTVDFPYLSMLREKGVNRLSLGVQSLDDGLLAAIGRIHTAAQAHEAVSMARAAGFENVNLDLMLGLPGQSVAQWERTLEEAIALAPEHLSCYSLIVEEGTPLSAQLERGECAPLPDEDALCRMDEITAQWTAQAGFARYEVSNYAKPGRECRHNIVYWACEPYLGLGCAAHSEMDGRRFYNPSDWAGYLRMAQSGTTARDAEGESTRQERMFERMMMGLRMVRGVDCARFARDFGVQPEEVWKEALARDVRVGVMERRGDYLRLTQRGMQVMNSVLVELL
ncbi:MAG: radical SAM family heme chaperone HemW [Selenomonadaceae bacterium]|nr:radical SAM family heme chaperone HemW [Selenomonadaceae bacterium]